MESSEIPPKRTKPIIGIAGGIGAGKSTVARILESLGASVIDADHQTHEQLADPEVVAELVDWWGDAVRAPSGEADRKAIANIVFHDATQRERLEDFLYPRLAAQRGVLIAEYLSDPAVLAIVLDAPKLIEAGLDADCDAVIFVEADRSTRVNRARDFRGWSEEELTRRENMQNALDSKRAIADHVVINHSSIDTLRSRVERVFSSLLASFA